MNRSRADDPTQWCPRCGYDLRGLIAAWTDRCPRRECCTECGFEIDWSEQFNDLRLPGWYVESTDRLLGVVARTPGTFLGLLPPGFAWSRISLPALSGVTSGRGLVVWLVTLLFACYLAYGLLVSTPLAVLHFRYGEAGPPIRTPGNLDGPVGLPEVGMAIVDPFGIALGYLVGDWRERFPALQRHRRAAADVWSGRRYSGSRRGFLGWIDPQTGRVQFSRSFIREDLLQPRRGLLMLGIACLTVPLCFLILRESRRRARVRAGLLIRLGLLAACIPAAVWFGLITMAAARQTVGVDWVNERTGIASRVELLLPLCGMGFLVLWWGSACRRLLRIELWPIVLFSIITIGLLAAVVLSLWVRPIGPMLL